MARTIDDIMRSIEVEASNMPELSQLEENPSRVGVWRYVKHVVAFVAHTLERMLDNHKKELEEQLHLQQIGSLNWYAQQALKYQQGHSIGLINFVPQYVRESAAARIIKHAAISVKPNGVVEVKVVKAGHDKRLIRLTQNELSGFQSYMHSISFAGIRVEASSEHPVYIRQSTELQVDNQINAPAGTNDGTEIYGVRNALAAYFKELPFNGWVRMSAIEDAMQRVEGVIDVHVSIAEYRGNEEWIAFSKAFQPSSGHAFLSHLSQFIYRNKPLNG